MSSRAGRSPPGFFRARITKPQCPILWPEPAPPAVDCKPGALYDKKQKKGSKGDKGVFCYAAKKDVPATKRCELLNLLSKKGVPFSEQVKVFEPMEDMTDEEKEEYSAKMIDMIRAEEED